MVQSRLSIFSVYYLLTDRKIGGTYMTLLNTITNLGTIYPSTFGMYLINLFNVKKCINVNQFDNNSSNFTSVYQKTNGTVNLFENQCSGGKESLECIKYGGNCQTVSYEYYFLNGFFSVVGIIWIFSVRKMVINLNGLPKSAWEFKRE